MPTIAQINRIVVLLWLLIPIRPLQAEDALLKDGRRVVGALSLAANGHLAFTAKDNNDSLPWDSVEQIAYTPTPFSLGPLNGLRTVVLRGGQTLTGKFHGWDQDWTHFQPLGMDRRVIAPERVMGVRNLPGAGPILEEDFADGLAAWNTEGKPALSEADKTSGKRFLNLNRAGQSVAFRPTDPFENGKVGVDFALPTSVPRGLWIIELTLAGQRTPLTVSLGIRGDGRQYHAEASISGKESARLACKAGRHRARIEFGPRKALVVLDDIVVWEKKFRRQDTTLKAIRVACAEFEGEAPTPFAIEAVNVTHLLEEPQHPAGYSEQDEVWLRSGDQLFGRVLKVDRRGIELETRGRRRKLPWSEVIGFYPRQDKIPPRDLTGEWIRFRVLTGTDGAWDEIEGVVTTLDERHLVLRHLDLGELSIDRSRLQHLRRLFFGRRIELDNGIHHLGDKERPVAALQPPRAEGQSLSRAFRLDEVPGVARFLVTVVQLKGPGDGIGPALKRGELRTEVWVNNERIDYLNRLVDRAQTRPQRLSVSIPKRLLRVGENVLEIRLTPEAGTDHFENCGLSELVIETEP